MERSSRQILYDARQQLARAKLGMDAIEELDRGRALAGLCNVAIFGRSVTWVLQNLRSTEPTFDEWYAPYAEAMKRDELCRYFLKLRNQIEKKGEVDVEAGGFYIQSLTGVDMARFYAAAPPGTTSMFMGDRFGRSGWTVSMPDGSEEVFFFEVPAEVGGPTDLRFPDAPKTHLGSPLGAVGVKELSRIYLDYLDGLIDAAEKQFVT